MAVRRRDFISSRTLIFGFLLIFFFSYQAWYKPQETPPPAPEDTTVPSLDLTLGSTTSTQTTPSQPSLLEPNAPEVSETLVAKASAPPSHHNETLIAIRDLIEQGKDVTAEEKLRALPDAVSHHPETRSYVATLWNNLGVLQKETRGPAASIASYQAGLALDPKSPALNLNLAQAYWETRDPELTREFLENLVQLVPQRPFPHLALADLLYRDDDLAGAAQHLERATRLARGNRQLASYLQLATAKVKAAQRTEQTFLARESSHFVVKFDGEEDHAIWHEVLTILEDAYRDIGQKLGHFPSQPIPVVLVTRQQFHSAMGTPAWADALFDPVLGRIKIPTQGALTDPEWLARVLRHEYVHALIHERMGLEVTAVPRWLNEGLAMQLAGDQWPDIDQVALSRNVTLVPLPLLERGWGHLSADAATLAYLQANSATHYLIDRYGMHNVREILDLLKARHNIGDAIQAKLMISYDVFQQRWTDNLNAKLSARSNKGTRHPSFE